MGRENPLDRPTCVARVTFAGHPDENVHVIPRELLAALIEDQRDEMDGIIGQAIVDGHLVGEGTIAIARRVVAALCDREEGDA